MAAAIAVWLPLPAWIVGQRAVQPLNAAGMSARLPLQSDTADAPLPVGMAPKPTPLAQNPSAPHGRAQAVWAVSRGVPRLPRAARDADCEPVCWTTRSIECLKPGDTVLAWDADSGQVRPQRIEAIFVRTARHLRVLEIADGQGRVQTLHTTDEHPFWSVNRCQFVPAGELHPGEGLRALDGGLVTVRSSRIEHHPRGIPVYNFRVARDHTYFAASTSAVPLLVHNADDQYVDLTDDEGGKHILEGDDRVRGGHRPGLGKPGKTEFPKGCSDEKILHVISDVATDPKVVWSTPDGRGYISGTKTVEGIDVKVVFDTKKGRIVTGYPTNLPRNP